MQQHKKPTSVIRRDLQDMPCHGRCLVNEPTFSNSWTLVELLWKEMSIQDYIQGKLLECQQKDSCLQKMDDPYEPYLPNRYDYRKKSH